MKGQLIGFCIWAIVGLVFIGMGIYDFFSKKEKPFNFWANTNTFPIKSENVKAYNRALGKLWIVFGFIFILLGLPLLDGQNSPWIILSILGVMLEAIIAIVIYILVIEKKYRKGA